MSKKYIVILFGLLLCVLVSACGAEPSWESGKVTEAAPKLSSENVQAKWTLNGGELPAAGKETRIQLQIAKNDGAAIEQFETNHEKLLHLIVISKDLSYFNHVHPSYKGDGTFEIGNVFPAGGEYRLIADFQPSGGDSMTKMTWTRIGGEQTKPAPVVPDKELVQVAEGKRVALSIDRLEAKTESKLVFSFSDERTGEPISDLEPYLGAIGHVVILSEDGERYLHVHAEEGQTAGPEAVFETAFPQSGTYKIWGQFQRARQVFTVAYVIKVP
ncbi:hypothetical protein [Paenibacillus hamazuiensis]|uniref:hypothetical protein n=1 Tax=Paenibacillus hamazuiensis TaxID=2936508 RepID=UPI00200E227F|nr:hypothetical protein [Paenibacillus hamazuiensis]